jgi:hypothetical protein
MEGGDRKVSLCPDIKDSLPKIKETPQYVPGCARLDEKRATLDVFWQLWYDGFDHGGQLVCIWR